MRGLLLIGLFIVATSSTSANATEEFAALHIERCEWSYIVIASQTFKGQKEFQKKYGKNWVPIEVTSRSKEGTSTETH
jgi:hypothetical protein